MAEARQQPTETQARAGRQLRAEYRSLQAQAKRNEDLNDPTKGDLQELIKQADNLHKNAEKPKEHALDAELFEVLATAGFQATRNLDAGSRGPSVGDFIKALNIRYVYGVDPQTRAREEPGAFHWEELDKVAAQVFKAAPGVNCMLGPLEAKAKVRKAPVRRAAAKRAVEVVRPEELKTVAAQDADKQETDRNMVDMWNILEKRGHAGTPVAELVLNHRSFAQTVENIFTLSFLVRDQRVQLWHDEAKGMCTRAVTKKPKSAQASGAAQQGEQAATFIITLNMDDWEVMKQSIRPGDCLMKHREFQEDHENEIQRRRQQEGRE